MVDARHAELYSPAIGAAGNVVVHAFYVRYLLPIWFDVQVIERVAAA